MGKFNAGPSHILTFIAECYKFTERNGITSLLKVDKDNIVDDLHEILDINKSHPGGVIAEIQNNCFEMLNVLELYYSRTANRPLLKRLHKLKIKYKIP